MAWPASHQDGRKAGGRASSELGAPAMAPGVSGRTKHSFGQDAAETGGWVGGLLGDPADHGCFPSLLPTHLPGSLPDTTPPSPTVELAVSRFPERGEGRGPRLLSHPSVPRHHRTGGTLLVQRPTGTGDFTGQAQCHAQVVGSILPPSPELGALSWPWAPTHVSPSFFLKRVGKDTAPRLAAWSPGAPRVP